MKKMKNRFDTKARRISLVGGAGVAASVIAFSLLGSSSATATTGTLNAPALTYTADSAGIHLHWSDNSTGEASFAVYRFGTGGEPNWTSQALHMTRNASGTGDAWSWLDAGAPAVGTSAVWHCYEVRAINNLGVQATSNDVCM